MALVSPRRLMPHHTLACVAVVAVMSGCASSAPEQRLLALPTPALPASAAPTAGPGTRWLQLGRLDIPEYWQSRSVRYREGTELKTWDNTVWAERVEVGLTRNLSIELEHALPAPWRLCPLRCEGATRHPVRALISLSPMDYELGTQTLTAWAQWTLLSDDGRVLRTSSAPVQSKGSGTNAAAQSDAMAGLMKAVAALVARDAPALPALTAGSAAASSARERLDAQNTQ